MNEEGGILKASLTSLHALMLSSQTQVVPKKPGVPSKQVDSCAAVAQSCHVDCVKTA